jgi:hypothetical protein
MCPEKNSENFRILQSHNMLSARCLQKTVEASIYNNAEIGKTSAAAASPFAAAATADETAMARQAANPESKKRPVVRMRLMEHIWNRVPSHCLIASQPDPGKMKPAVRTLCGLVD